METFKTNEAAPCSHCAGTEFRVIADPATELAIGECGACGTLTLYRLPPLRPRSSSLLGKAAAVALAAMAILAAVPPARALEIVPQTPSQIEKNSRDGCSLIALTIQPGDPVGFLGTCQNQRAFGATPASCTASMLALFRRWHDEPTSFAERPNVTVGCIMLLTGVPEAVARFQAKE